MGQHARRKPEGEAVTTTVDRLELVRADTLPDNYPYKDDGCRIAPRCLNCPLERCIYDYDDRNVQRAARRARQDTRQKQVAELLAQGLFRIEIARRIGASLRTVERDLKEIRT